MEREPADEAEGSVLAGALRRDGWIVLGALAAACLLAWLWLLRQALATAPVAEMGPPPGSLLYWLGAFVMWSLMMVAMMLPSAAPMILFYDRVARQRRARRAAMAPTLLFAGVYLLAWIGFAAVAALAQSGLVASGALSATRLAIGDPRLAGALLLVAGAYQLTPLKHVCLLQCRSPIGFVMQHWRPGWRGALSLGLRHAFFCIACCWALMALLFVGGVMSLAWVAFLALIVLVEKVAPIGELGAKAVGVAAVALGLALVTGLLPHLG
jgi:predicted metal-binding membrane protein